MNLVATIQRNKVCNMQNNGTASGLTHNETRMGARKVFVRGVCLVLCFVVMCLVFAAGFYSGLSEDNKSNFRQDPVGETLQWVHWEWQQFGS